MSKYDLIKQELLYQFQKNIEIVVDEEKLIADICLKLDCSSKMVNKELKLLYSSKTLENNQGKISIPLQKQNLILKSKLRELSTALVDLEETNSNLSTEISKKSVELQNMQENKASVEGKLEEFENEENSVLEEKEKGWEKEKETFETEIENSKVEHTKQMQAKVTEIEKLKSEIEAAKDAAENSFHQAKLAESNMLRLQEQFHRHGGKLPKSERYPFERKQTVQTIILFAVIGIAVVGGARLLWWLFSSGVLLHLITVHI